MFFKILILFFALTVSTTLLLNVFDLPFGATDFWQNHGVLFLVAITLFPRLTLLFSSIATGGVLWWLGWLFVPRILVAVLATVAYWYTNPILVICAWLVALGGETSEKYAVSKKVNYVYVQRRYS